MLLWLSVMWDHIKEHITSALQFKDLFHLLLTCNLHMDPTKLIGSFHFNVNFKKLPVEIASFLGFL